VRFTLTRHGRAELEISDRPDRARFERIAALLAFELDGRIVERLDSFDCRYWDIEVGGTIVTLHLHDMVGICLFAAAPEGDALIPQAAALIERSPTEESELEKGGDEDVSSPREGPNA
jgi:hypothetical protein